MRYVESPARVLPPSYLIPHNSYLIPHTFLPYQTSTGPLGTGIAVRSATPGSCMKLATIGGG